MPRSAALDQDALTSTVEAALGVKGALRVRSYGNVKHAHVILRKVDEEKYEDSQGRQRTRGVFSLFAHKLINVKPGKELFMYIHPVGGDLQERVVAFEADLLRLDEKEEEKTITHESTRSDQTVVQQEQALPPKMRKLWARKVSSPILPVVDVAPTKMSVGIQAQAPTSTAEMQASPPFESMGTQTHCPLRLDSGMQTFTQRTSGPVSHAETQTIEPFASSSSNCMSSPLRIVTESQHDQSTECDAENEAVSESSYSSMSKMCVTTGLSINLHQRSLSPMEIESGTSTPLYSPQLDLLDLTPETTVYETNSCPEPQAIIKQEEDAVVLSGLSTADVSEPQNIPVIPLIEHPSSQTKFASPAGYSRPPSSLSSYDSTEPPPTVGLSTNHSNSHAPRQSPVSSVPGVPRDAPSGPPQAGSFSGQKLKQLTDLANALSAAKQLPSPVGEPSGEISHLSDVNVSALAAWALSCRATLEQSQSPDAIHLLPVHQAPKQPSSENPLKRPWSTTHTTDNSDSGGPSQSKRWKPIIKPEPKSPLLYTAGTSNGRIMDPDTFTLVELRAKMGMGGRPPTPPPCGGPRMSPSFPSGTLCGPSWTVLPSDVSNLNLSCVDIAGVKTERLENSANKAASASDIPRPAITHDLTRTLTDKRLSIDLALPAKPTNSVMSQQDTVSSSGRRGTLCKVQMAQIKMGRDAGIRAIVFNSTGKLFAVICRDNTVRIWDNTTRTEIAKLAHSSSVVSVVWLEGETAVASLGSNGNVSKWTMLGENKWEWAKLVDSGDSDPACLAYCRNRLAVANPRKGVKIWLLKDGRWRELDRSVPRKDVVTIGFVNNGDALLCGSADGTVFRCTVPKCRVQPVTSLNTKVYRLDIDASSKFAVVAEAGGRAHLLDLSSPSVDDRGVGRIVQEYSPRDADRFSCRLNHAFGAIFAHSGDTVVFGSLGGRVLLWDTRKGRIKYEMNHGSDILVQAVASFDGKNGDRYLISGTRQGKLAWWTT